MRRLLVGAAVVALCAIGGPASGIAATPSPSPSPSATPSGSAQPGSLQSSDAITAELTAALARQQELNAAKTALASEIAAAQSESTQLQQLMTANQAQITATMAQIEIQQRTLADATQRASFAQDRADADFQRAATDRDALATAIREEYEHPDGFVGFILAGNDLGTMMERVAQIRALTSGAADLVNRLRSEEADAKAEQAEAQAQEDRARQAAAALQAQKDALTAETQREQSIVDQLGGQMSAAAGELHSIDGEDAAVAQRVAELRIEQLDRIIADAEQAAWDAAQLYLKNNLTGLPQSAITIPPPPTTGTAVLQQTGSATGTRPLVWPAPGAIVSQGFGPSPYPFEPPAFGVPHFHTGIDMAAPTGTPIRAAAAGVVVAATPGSTGYGNHIVIASDQHVMSLYGHLQAMLVKVGDTVVQGELIGLMGSTGNSTGSHLHFEVRVDGMPIDPAPLLQPPPNH